MKKRSGRWHTVYSIISTLLQEAGIALLLLWLLPIFGVTAPWWVVVLVMSGFAVFSYFMYRIGHPTILYKEVNAPESIIGQTGTVERSLEPEGYVRVYGELWRAGCTGGHIARGEEITVTAIEGLKLTVVKKVRSD